MNLQGTTRRVAPCLGVALSKSVNPCTSAGTLKPASFCCMPECCRMFTVPPLTQAEAFSTFLCLLCTAKLLLCLLEGCFFFFLHLNKTTSPEFTKSGAVQQNGKDSHLNPTYAGFVNLGAGLLQFPTLHVKSRVGRSRSHCRIK